MKKICDVPFKELKIGDRCISAIGTPGYISRLIPEPEDRYDCVEFQWENGNDSYVFHMNCDKIHILKD